MNAFFTALGKTVARQWQSANFSLARFPEIAGAALENQPPSEQIDLADLMREFLLEDEQPFQTASGFGQPELVVFDDPRFYIQVLCWLEGTTDIHQHMFSGAFHVMLGSSLHAEFEFAEAEVISAHLRVGDLQRRGVRLLETGSTVPIRSGRDQIHALFHLEMPSVSVVIRTHSDPGTGPQWTYLPPHLAIDPFQDDALTTRRKQLLDLLENVEDSRYAALVAEMLAQLDFERGFFILQNGATHLRSLGAWEETWAVFAQRHGRLADYVEPTLEEIRWRDTLVGLRASVTEVEHRFFLALLLNVPRRADIWRFVGQRFPGPPEETIRRWLTELTETSALGTWLLEAEFPPELKVPAARQAALFHAALLDPPRKKGDRIQRALRETLVASSLRAFLA